VFRNIGLDLAPGVDSKNTTPEDIARTSLPHTIYWLQRAARPRQRRFSTLKLRARAKKRADL